MGLMEQLCMLPMGFEIHLNDKSTNDSFRKDWIQYLFEVTHNIYVCILSLTIVTFQNWSEISFLKLTTAILRLNKQRLYHKKTAPQPIVQWCQNKN